jgi:hypothetical protein
MGKGSVHMQQNKLRLDQATAALSPVQHGRSVSVRPPSRAVEALARKLYEASNPGGVSWVRCGWTVRETWLDKALLQHEGGGHLLEWLFPWRRHGALIVLAVFGLMSFEQGACAAGPSLFQFEIQAAQHCPADTVVWVSPKSGLYRFSSERGYGRTKDGFFVCQLEGDKAGYKAIKR